MTQANVIVRLKADLAELQGFSGRQQKARVSMGVSALDSLLPGGGVRAGSLIEWISAGNGGGATTLLLHAAARNISCHRPLVVIDGSGEFYPPSIGALFASIEGTGRSSRSIVLVIRPSNEAESVWAMEQVLRCPAVGLMLGWVERLSDRAARRLQLAAERGACAGMLIRPASEESAPFWAEARFRVDPIAAGESRRLRVSLVRCRGGQAGGSLELVIDDETGAVRLAPEVAAPAPLHRAAGA
jgi:protein ImuA